MEVAQLNQVSSLHPPCPSLSHPTPHFSYVLGKCELSPHSRDISDLPAQHPSAKYMDSTGAFPLTSTATGFIPLSLLASLFPHGLLFYLEVHDCI